MDTKMDARITWGNDNSGFSLNEVGSFDSMDGGDLNFSNDNADSLRWLADVGVPSSNVSTQTHGEQLLEPNPVNIQRDSVNSKLSLYDQDHVPDLYESGSVVPSVQPLMQAGLAWWQTEILRLWSINIGRVASKTDILFFRGILEAKEEAISASLQAVLNEGRRTGSFGKAPQICNEGSSSWMQNSVPGVEQRDEGPTVDGRSTPVSGNIQPKNHAPVSTFFPNALADAYNQAIVPDQTLYGHPSYAKNILLLGDIGTSTSRFRTSSDRGKQRQVEHAVHESSTIAHAPVCVSSMGGLGNPAISSRRLRDLIGQIISKKAARGCGSIRGHEHQQGPYKCTLGCGRRFKSSADTFRHEEIVYPQNFWFCLACGDPNNPLENHVFTREDKMRHHLRRLNHDMDISHCRVPNIRTLYPVRCGLCSNHRHSNWKERCKHLIRHCKKGDFATNARTRGTAQVHGSINGNDDGDDDDDDEDDDDDSDETPQDEPDGSNEDGNGGASNDEGPSARGPKRNADGYDPDRLGSFADDDDDDGFYGSFIRDSPGLYYSMFSLPTVSEMPEFCCRNHGVQADIKTDDNPRSHGTLKFDNRCYAFKLVDLGTTTFSEDECTEVPRQTVSDGISPHCKFTLQLLNAQLF
jgi:hypothetical protein